MPDEHDQLFENIPVPIKTILLAEDDTTIAELLVQMISQETHYQVFTVPDGPQALELVKNIKPQLLIWITGYLPHMVLNCMIGCTTLKV